MTFSEYTNTYPNIKMKGNQNLIFIENEILIVDKSGKLTEVELIKNNFSYIEKINYLLNIKKKVESKFK